MPVRSFEQKVKRMKPFSKLNYYPVWKEDDVYKDPMEETKTRATSLHFYKDDKEAPFTRREYSILVMEPPSCCGCRIFISDQEIPLDILDPLAEEYEKSMFMLIFVMPQLPSLSLKIYDGVSVLKTKRKNPQYYDVPLTHYKGSTGFRRCHPSNRDNAFVNGAVRLNKNVYYFYDLDVNYRKLDSFMACLKPGNVVLAISIRRQFFANRSFKNKLTLIKKGVNPRTDRTLFLYYAIIGKQKRTLWNMIKNFIRNC